VSRQPFAIRRLLLVADEPVAPDVGDFDFKLVAGGLQQAGRNIHAPRRSPHDAEVAAVQPHPRDMVHRAEVKPCGRRAVEGRPVGRRAGVVPDAGLSPFRPILQQFKLHGCRPAPLRIETHLPRSSNLRDRLQRGEVPP